MHVGCYVFRIITKTVNGGVCTSLLMKHHIFTLSASYFGTHNYTPQNIFSLLAASAAYGVASL